MSDFFSIPLSSLHESPTNPRKHFNEASLAELAANVKEVGVLQPLLVRQFGANGDYEIIAGARRFRAARLAGIAEVPVHCKQLTDSQVLEIQLIENLQREDVHPLEEALGYRQLLTMAGYTVQDIAAKVAKDESYVYRRLKLTDLCELGQAGLLVEIALCGYGGADPERLEALAAALNVDLKSYADAARDEAEIKSGKRSICHGNGCTKTIPASKKYCAEHEPKPKAKSTRKPAKKTAAKKAKKS